ncbi:MAG: hypothetical protein EOP88_03275 [Verrucomicrobiaceae bacterium]|nr:MAG: hypothetical protein EOP88_03275 [Verrucomicrobiaceae bacterium]
MSKLSKILLAVVIVSLLVASRQADEAERLQTENRSLERQVGRLTTPVHQPPHDTSRSRGGTGEVPRPKPGLEVEEALRQQIVNADNGIHEDYGTHFSLMEEGQDGVSPAAAKAAGLTGEESEQVSRILKKAWDSAAEDFARRAELIEEDSDEKAGRTVYMISARADRGWGLKDVLLAELGDAVGAEKRALLMRGYQSNRFFGGFGADDVRLEFTAGASKYSFTYLNPLDGSDTYYGSSPLEEFSHRFGDSFEIPGISRSEK